MKPPETGGIGFCTFSTKKQIDENGKKPDSAPGQISHIAGFVVFLHKKTSRF
jgi:hypothetical protein